MGRFKQLDIEMQEAQAEQGNKAEREIDFDHTLYADSDWWEMLDRETVAQELNDSMEALEIEAEIFELRSLGVM